MSPTDARSSRRRGLVAPLLAVLAVSGCDLFANAYSCGYEVGHGSVDALLNAEEERQANVDAWAQACDPPRPVDAATQAAGDASCSDDNAVEDILIVCDDPGLDVGTQPSGCAPFHKGDIAIVESDSFECPSGVSGACLCCRDAPGSCLLGGASCESDAVCCSGNCQADDGGPGNHCN